MRLGAGLTKLKPEFAVPVVPSSATAPMALPSLLPDLSLAAPRSTPVPGENQEGFLPGKGGWALSGAG